MSLEYLRGGFRYLTEYLCQAACVFVAKEGRHLRSRAMDGGNRSSFGSLRARASCLGGGSNETSEESTTAAAAVGLLKFRSGHSLGEVATRDSADGGPVCGGTLGGTLSGTLKPKNGANHVFEFSRSGGDCSPVAISPRLRFDSPHGMVDGLFDIGAGGVGGGGGTMRPKACHPLCIDSDLENCCTLRPRCHTTDFALGSLEGYVIGGVARARAASASRNSSPLRSPQKMKLRNGDGIRSVSRSIHVIKCNAE